MTLRARRASTTRRDALVFGAATLVMPTFVRHARAADAPRFELGIASGHPGPAGVVLWTRLTGPDLPERVDVRWEIARDERFTDIAARGTEVALAADAHSVHAEPADLATGQRYWYRFEAMGQRSAVGRTRTAPAADAFQFYVQAGAFTRAEDAEQQRAKLAMLGYAAKVTEREQSGRTVFRVRAGPYDTREAADGAQTKLQEAGIEARLVRVEK